ncbi:unnamed protein product [Echinostoma caproni]|uniref:BTB domain-containing protein n=1 Tax=Echinostoma caproni TaxID=27848 RepID=A0A183AMS1_9TREM|nr:unnamed protein product [Echinostoma caproni]
MDPFTLVTLASLTAPPPCRRTLQLRPPHTHKHTHTSDQNSNGTECDFHLISGDTQRPIHRCLIRALSPVIDQAITVSDNSHSSTSYDLSALSVDTLDQLIRYVYTSEITLNPRTAVEIHTAAVQLQVNYLSQVSMDYIRGCINTDTCVSILKHAVANNCTTLRQECIQCCATHYEQIMDKPEFVQIPPTEFMEIVSLPSLAVHDEHKLFDSIKRWLAEAPKDRDSYATKLSECVRFQLFEVGQLLDMLQDPENTQFHAQMRKALIDFGALAGPIARQKWERKSPETSETASEVTSPISPQPQLDAEENGTSEVMQLQSESDTDHITVTGGTCETVDKESATEDTNSLDTEQKTENTMRSYVLTVFGGRSSEKKLLKDIVCYRVRETGLGASETDRSKCEIELKLIGLNNTRPLPNVRKGFGAASIWNQAFLIGGQPAASLQTVDVYDVRENEWLIGPALRTGRAWHGVTQSEHTLFAVGGSGRGVKRDHHPAWLHTIAIKTVISDIISHLIESDHTVSVNEAFRVLYHLS